MADMNRNKTDRTTFSSSPPYHAPSEHEKEFRTVKLTHEYRKLLIAHSLMYAVKGLVHRAELIIPV